MTTINKSVLIDIIAKNTGVTKKDTGVVIDGFIDAVSDALVNGDKVFLTGFATFETVEVAERNGRNPKTGDTVVIPAHKKVKVKIGKSLKDSVLGKDEN